MILYSPVPNKSLSDYVKKWGRGGGEGMGKYDYFESKKRKTLNFELVARSKLGNINENRQS